MLKLPGVLSDYLGHRKGLAVVDTGEQSQALLALAPGLVWCCSPTLPTVLKRHSRCTGDALVADLTPGSFAAQPMACASHWIPSAPLPGHYYHPDDAVGNDFQTALVYLHSCRAGSSVTGREREPGTLLCPRSGSILLTEVTKRLNRSYWGLSPSGRVYPGPLR